MKLLSIVPENCLMTENARQAEITHLTIDSRKCVPGSLYFAINGTQVDGHKFVGSALKNGAAAAVVEHPVEEDIPQVIVPDTRAAMAHIAAAFYGYPANDMKMIGVTGTNGKTSISYMVRAIAEKAGVSCGVIGTSGIYLNREKLEIPILTATTPDPIELQYALSVMREKGAQWVIMEVTAHALDLRKVKEIAFASAGFTNLTQDHLDYFDTMENYGAAKKKLFAKEQAQAGVLNLDDPFCREILAAAEIPMLTYAIGEQADLQAENVRIHPAGSEFTLRYQGQTVPVTTRTTGLFNISNVLCAVGCALQAGASLTDALNGIAAFASVPGRFETVPAKDGVSVIVDYAHTPDGLENVLKAVNSFKKGKLICVFGCGGNRDAAKRPIMGEISGKLADYTILTSDNPRLEEPEAIIDAIEEGMKRTNGRYERFADRKTAIARALELAQTGDVIAICGKGDEDYQDIQGIKHHFSDREVVEALSGGKQA